jgi:hypothetical protein
MISRATLYVSILLASLAPVTAAAQCGGQCILPPCGCAWSGTDHVSYGAFQQNSLALGNCIGSLSCGTFPALGNSLDVPIDGVATFGLSGDGGVSYALFGASSAHFLFHLNTTAMNGNDMDMQTELLQMDLTTYQGYQLRESPTLASTGQCHAMSTGGGNFQITGFFDVFVELSTDGGQTWTPGSAPEHITPVFDDWLPVKETTWGSVKATYR